MSAHVYSTSSPCFSIFFMSTIYPSLGGMLLFYGPLDRTQGPGYSVLELLDP